MASRNYSKKPVSQDVQFSKAMSYLLRHGAEKERIPIREDGYVRVRDLLAHRTLQQATEADLVAVVQNCPKQRFKMDRLVDESSGREELYVRANQGHSMSVEIEMKEITETDQIDQCIHGTYYAAWNSIKTQGLSRMGRQHIHMSEDFPGSKEVISGMRKNCQVAVFVDVSKALKDGIKFYRTANNVIVSPGDSNGLLKPQYFVKVFDLKSNTPLEF